MLLATDPDAIVYTVLSLLTKSPPELLSCVRIDEANYTSEVKIYYN